MNNNRSFLGSNVALITPMFDDGEVDYASLENLIDFHIDAGTSSIVSVGTTGESATIGVTEHLRVIDHTIEYSAIPTPSGNASDFGDLTVARQVLAGASDTGADRS